MIVGNINTEKLQAAVAAPALQQQQPASQPSVPAPESPPRRVEPLICTQRSALEGLENHKEQNICMFSLTRDFF